MIQVVVVLLLVLLLIFFGVIVDNYDWCKIMFWGFSFEMIGVMFVILLVFFGYFDLVLLIIFIFWIFFGGLVIILVWQVVVNEQVLVCMVSDVVLFNSVNYNVVCVVGLVFGGLLLSVVGLVWVFLFNSFCYMVLIWVIWQWWCDVFKCSLLLEGIFEGVIVVLCFIQYLIVICLVMMCFFVFGFFVSVVWVLLLLLVYCNLDGDVVIYGYMFGVFGFGVIFGSIQVLCLCQWIGSSWLISLVGFILVLILLIFGLVDNFWVLFLVLIFGGGCWIGVFVIYNLVVQIFVFDWIKVCVLVLYQIVLYGGLVLGLFFWGYFVEIMIVYGVLLVVGCLLLVLVIFLYNLCLLEMDVVSIFCVLVSMFGQLSFVFNMWWGMVLVFIEYWIFVECICDFVCVVQLLCCLCLCNGVECWLLFCDVSNLEVWQELFLVDNWIQYLCMFDCMILVDKIVIDNVIVLYVGDGLLQICYCVSYEVSSYDMLLVKSVMLLVNDEVGVMVGS